MHALATLDGVGWNADGITTATGLVLLKTGNDEATFWAAVALTFLLNVLLLAALYQMKANAGAANIALVRFLRVYMR